MAPPVEEALQALFLPDNLLPGPAKERAEADWRSAQADAVAAGAGRWADEPQATVDRCRARLAASSDTHALLCQLVQDGRLLDALVTAHVSGVALRDVRDYRGRNLLCLAGRAAGAVLVLGRSCGVDVHHRSEAGSSAIHRTYTAATVDAMMALGADVNARNNGGTTALFYASNPSAVLRLLHHGADPTLLNSYGHSALHLASSNGNWRVLWLLLRAGASNTARGRDGTTPLELMERMLQGVQRPDGKVNRPTHERQLHKATALLRLWDEVCGAAPAGASHRQRFAAFERRCAAVAHAHIAKEPRLALANACGIPLELADIILTNYVNMFLESRDLSNERDYDQRLEHTSAYQAPTEENNTTVSGRIRTWIEQRVARESPAKSGWGLVGLFVVVLLFAAAKCLRRTCLPLVLGAFALPQ